MFYINELSHIPFLQSELKRLLPEGTFSSRLWRAIGSELHYRLVDWPDENETEYSRLFPMDALFVWVTSDSGFDPEWLAGEDGSYLDDDGEVVPWTIETVCSPIEQMAAYGLWLLDKMIDCRGSIPSGEINEQGWKRDEVIEHQAACMLLAYQALSYSQRIMRGSQPSAEEKKRAEQFDFSAIGKIGAQKRHAPMVALRVWAVEKYHSGEWSSANQAAHALKESVITYGRTINANLSDENAQRTIADWFRKYV